MIALLIIFAASGLIAFYAGSKRYIGAGWSFFFCITGGLLLGLPLVFSSTKKGLPPKNNGQSQKTAGWIVIVIGILGLLGLVNAGFGTDFNNIPDRGYSAIGQAFSFIFYLVGLGIYLVNTANFNIKWHSNTQNITHRQPQKPGQTSSSNSPYNYKGGHNSTTGAGNQSSTYQQPNHGSSSAVTSPPPSHSSSVPSSKAKEFDGKDPYAKN